MNNNLQGKKDSYNLIKNYDSLLNLMSQKKTVYSRTDIINLLAEIKDTTNVKKNLSLKRFLYFLLQETKSISEVQILMPDTHIAKRYVFNNQKVSPYEIALSLQPGSYLSHYSALFANDLTLNNPKRIYINREQSPKPVDKKNSILTQKKVDYAFSKPMRSTNNIATFTYEKIEYKVFMLNGKNTNKLGVNSKKVFGFSMPVKTTDIERSLIDCTVRPAYSGGIEEILDAFKEAKDLINVDKLIKYLKKINYIYPVEQAIMFYMNQANYSKNSIHQLKKYMENKEININFYLDYQITNKALDKVARVYYPKDLGYEKLDIDNIIVCLKKAKQMLGVPRIASIKFYKDGSLVSTRKEVAISNQLANTELHHEDNSLVGYYDEIRELFRNELSIDISYVDIELEFI